MSPDDTKKKVLEYLENFIYEEKFDIKPIVTFKQFYLIFNFK